MTATRRSMGTFVVVWAGQLVSLVGTNLTGFALAIFVYLETGSVTQLSLVILAAQVPQLLVTPFAGALVDGLPGTEDSRWSRAVPVVSACVVIVLGLGITARALLAGSTPL